MPIVPIQSVLPHVSEITPPAFSPQSITPGDKQFSQSLSNAIGDVNQMLNQSDKLVQNMAVGKAENLHEAMIAVEKADTAFKLLVQVRNKAIEAYNEIIHMQV